VRTSIVEDGPGRVGLIPNGYEMFAQDLQAVGFGCIQSVEGTDRPPILVKGTKVVDSVRFTTTTGAGNCCVLHTIGRGCNAQREGTALNSTFRWSNVSKGCRSLD
jgi:hypothetical protein